MIEADKANILRRMATNIMTRKTILVLVVSSSGELQNGLLALTTTHSRDQRRPGRADAVLVVLSNKASSALAVVVGFDWRDIVFGCTLVDSI